LYPFLYPFLFSVPEKEVLVIGLDGLDYTTLQSLIEEKKLPNLQAIVSNGTFATFKNMGSLDSYSAWNSLAKCDGNSLWDELEKRNISFGTLYWPNVPEKGSFMVPDEFEGRKEWPEEIYDSKALLLLKNPITEFFRKVYWLKIMLPQNKAEKDLVYEFYLLDKKAREFFYLREKFKPTATFLVLSSPLRIEQYFWIYAHPEKFKDYSTEAEREKYGKVIENYLIELDDFIGKINKQGKTVIIISNRGIKEIFPPKIVDKIDINKILKEVGVLEFDYRGEIDFSKTKAYTLEEGLDQELKIFVKDKQVQKELKDVFENAKALPSGQKIFIVEEFEDGIILKRNISFTIQDEKISISNKTLNLNDLILRRIISVGPSEKGFLIVNKKIDLPKDFSSEDFCSIILNLIH
jgi:predicted AlkP superfamily phosphohydrolase/phosphomutase